MAVCAAWMVASGANLARTKNRPLSRVPLTEASNSVNRPVLRIMSWVKLPLFTVMLMRFGLLVSWAAVLMMQPLSLSPSLAVSTNRP